MTTIRRLPWATTMMMSVLMAHAGGVRADVEGMDTGALSERLWAAIAAGDPNGAEVALQSGADPTAADATGELPLHAAVRRGDPAIVQSCLDYCADWKVRGRCGQNALFLAVVRGRTDLVTILLESGADPNVRLESPVAPEFREMVSPPWLREQLRHDPGITPLMLAGARGDEPMVRTLLESGARRAIFSHRYKMPPVSFACRAGHTRVTQLLVGHDPDRATERRRLVISLSRQQVRLYRGDKLVLVSSCSTGRQGYATPKGTFVVTSKHPVWESNLYHVPMPYFLRLNGSAIGLHQGVVPDYPASHGCIRVPARYASQLFRAVSVGDPVHISE